MTLYPLRFEPLLRRYLWGGRRLETCLSKSLPPGDDYAESWEVVDHPDGQSRVRYGSLEGCSLHELCQEYAEELMGNAAHETRFPLLFKFIDAQDDLSVQVHPNDQQAAILDPPDRGKTEAWVVLHAESGSRLYAGLKEGTDRQQLERAMHGGNIESCLHSFAPRVGDSFLIHPGVVHAIGAGLVIAEIQQASNTTFRLHDWNRVDGNGRPRPLHIEQGLEVIDFQQAPVVGENSSSPDVDVPVERLVACEQFVMDRRCFAGRCELPGEGRFHLLAVLAGEVRVNGDPAEKPLATGQTCLVPASVGPVGLVATGNRVVLLDMYLP